MQYNHPWIDAYWEPKQGIKSFKNCLALVDLEANTEHKLVCVNFTDSRASLKVSHVYYHYSACALLFVHIICISSFLHA